MPGTHLGKNFVGKHFYQFYKTSNDYLRSVRSFFRYGFLKSHACLWLVSYHKGFTEAEARSQVVDPFFEEYAFSKSQFEVIPAEEWYCTNRIFDKNKALANVQAYLMKMKKMGFTLLRIVGDAGAIRRIDWPKFHEYEREVSQSIRDLPIVALCAYPILQCSIADTRSVIENHDMVLNCQSSYE